MIDTEELMRLAKAATPGEWRTGRKVPNFLYSAGGDPICQCDSFGELPRMEECRNAAFIAAANPSTILALLAERAAIQPRTAVSTDEWIGVGERLPEQRDAPYQVIVACVKKHTGMYAGKEVRRFIQDWVVRQWPENFTHWMEAMPWPAPPATETP